MNTQATTRLTGTDFRTRAAQVAAIHAAVLADGTPEVHADTTALCTHFKTRRGLVGGEQAEAQVTTHEAGTVIRFYVYGADFSVKVRDLILLPTPDKGAELWLEIDGKLFPHEGKYSLAARQIVAAMMNKR